MLLIVCLFAVGNSGCKVPFWSFFSRNMESYVQPIKPVANKPTTLQRSDARLAVTWVGHATVLIQMDDKFFLTDPNLTSTVGMLSKRFYEPGIDIEKLPTLSAVLVSHMHFDHLSYGSLDEIEDKTARLFVPQEGLTYTPNYSFPTIELRPWQTWTRDGVSITAVPVQHRGGRYGLDESWMKNSCTGYVLEYHGMRVYFGGDTGYNDSIFTKAGARFPNIDCALMPIAPIHPREFMKRAHTDPIEALQGFIDLKAKHMMPIHFDTYSNSTADTLGEASGILRTAMQARGITDTTVTILPIGGQWVVIPKRN